MSKISLAGLQDGSVLGFPIFPDGIPKQLREAKCWIVTELRKENGKILKPPMQGFMPKDASTWRTFNDAVIYAAEMNATGNYDGCYPAAIIPDGFIVVDLDNHTGQDNETLDALYNGIIKPFGGGFIERSISGRGWHITGQAVWDSMYSLTAKSDEGIDIQIRQPGGYILLTGNLHKSGQPQLVNIESFLPVLHDYFKESLIPEGMFDANGEHLPDEEVLSRIAADYPILHLQLTTSLQHGPVAQFGEFGNSDNSERLFSCFRGLYDICLDPEQVYRIIIQLPVGKWENRSEGKKQYNTPDKYYKFLHEQVHKSCARAAASKADLSGVELNLDPDKEWAPKDRSSELPENESVEQLSPFAFYKTAPDNMKVVLDYLAGTDGSRRELVMDYAIAAALTMAGLATGKTRTVTVDGHQNYIAPALIVLGASGTGKSVTTSFIDNVNMKAMLAPNGGRPNLKDKTTEHTTSPKRLAKYMGEMNLNKYRGFTLVFDEATEFFTALNANNHSYFSQYILEATMKRKRGGVLVGNDRADADKDVERVLNPCFGILMASVEQPLLDLLDRKKVTDGTLSRFLCIPDSGMRFIARTAEQLLAEELESATKNDVPDDIMLMYELMAGEGTPPHEKDVNIRFADMKDKISYLHEMEKLKEAFQDDMLRQSFYQRMPLHWSHLVGCLAMYENPQEPVITRRHCDWAFKYILRCIQAFTHKLNNVATDASDSSDVGKNIMDTLNSILTAYGKNKDWEQVKKEYPTFVKKGKNVGILPAHLDAMAFAPGVLIGKASKFVAKDERGNKAFIVKRALDDLVNEGALELQTIKLGDARKAAEYYVIV